MGYWPWWLGAAALATVAVGFTAAMKRSFGVSGIYARLLNWHEEREAEHFEKRQDAVRDALIAATRERFGADAVERGAEPGVAETPAVASPLPVSVGLTFVVFIFVGGLISNLVGRETGVNLGMGEDFTRLVGSGWSAWLVLVTGGVLVGFGTRMSAGCTSGHGLFGCARLRPASILATVAFFGAGVVVSLALGAL